MSKKSRPVAVPPEKHYPLFDAHTHLYSAFRKSEQGGSPETYRDGVERLMDRAAGSGLVGVCTVGDGFEETERALEAAHFHPRVWAACAIHPTRAHELDEAARARLTEMADDPRCVAIGETGLDTYWLGKDESTPSLDVQEEALRWHIDLAVSSGKPLMIHNREADEDLMRVLDDAPRPVNVILHCFSSPLDVAKEALERGYILSFAGNSTFKRNVEMREAARIAPAEQILVETDAPYMTPEPFRGQRNEPSFVGYTARMLADVRDVSAATLAAQVTENARRIYGLGEITEM
ncbi:TatD family hydrolase [Corynebacterium sp. ED61]|uniref:TatD family hydrolase n=1 Tax=Corynebacterium sp. ED61 TaxID=2211360 RepID=UPI001883FF27|nr:TatD family hydrolase [Corynebacterium sp. ED61]MBF0581196.1 TatD family hydrolase [Corynebacterium sp. ED61]